MTLSAGSCTSENLGQRVWYACFSRFDYSSQRRGEKEAICLPVYNWRVCEERIDPRHSRRD